MKKYILQKPSLWALFTILGLSVLFASCEKINGHVISTSTVVKAGTLTFNMHDTTRTLSTTTADTVSFNTLTSTTITAKNGQKKTSCVFSFPANTAGTFSITSLVITIPQANGTLTTTTNAGSVTVDAINITGGSISGSFTSTVSISNTQTVPVTGTFTIQQ